MMIYNAKMTSSEKRAYDVKFATFLNKLLHVAKLTPRERFLYPVIRGVAYQDFDTALDIALKQRFKKVLQDID